MSRQGRDHGRNEMWSQRDMRAIEQFLQTFGDALLAAGWTEEQLEKLLADYERGLEIIGK